MTEREATHTEAAAGAERESPRRPYHFYQHYSEMFRQSLANENQKAYDRWGYSMLFSLSDEDAARQLPEMGYAVKDALDHYNRGCILAQQEDFEGARKSFQQAIDSNLGLSEAHYNLALTLEKLGKNAEARKAWEAALLKYPDDSGRAEIEAHLNDLPK